MNMLAKALELIQSSDAESLYLAPLTCQQALAYAAIAQAETAQQANVIAERRAVALERIATTLENNTSTREGDGMFRVTQR